MGAGAAALGLKGQVGGEALDRVLAGEHPATGAPLGRVLAARRPGFDLTFSAPKSRERAVRHRRRSAARRRCRTRTTGRCGMRSGYLEREAAVTRRGPAGVHAIAGNGFVAAAFRHRTSRAGDPQLHTHVLVANLTLGADGHWSTLDGRRIYAHAKTAGYLYEARLRSLLTRELGVEWTPVRNGIADIAGVPPARAAGVQPPAGRDRGRARATRRVGRRGRAGRRAGDPARQGLSRDAGAARARVARACGRASAFRRERIRELMGRSAVAAARSGARAPDRGRAGGAGRV